MTDFYYTKEYDVDSSLVEAILYDENEKVLTLALNGEYYSYPEVQPHDVARLVESPSVGAYFNNYFKRVFGPGEYLGNWSQVAGDLVSVEKSTPGTPKALVDTTNSSGFEYDLNRFDVKTNESASDSTVHGPTKEYSLTLPNEAAVEVDDDVKVIVHFTLDGFDKKYKYVAKATDVSDAVEELNDYVASFGATGKVRKVVVKFD